MPKFSVVIPTVNRPGLVRAVRSIICQEYEDWELIVVDDKSPEQVRAETLLGDFSPCISAQVLRKIRVFRLIDKGGKLIARNFGMSSATGEWICWLDDDDEYSCRYLEYVNKHLNENRDFSVCNFGMIRYWRGGKTDVFPIHDFRQHQVKSGMISTGMFVFARACLEKSGYFPQAKTWQEFSKQSGIEHYDGSSGKGVKPMGDPWGDDFWFFWRLSQHFESVPLQAYLYYKHIKGGGLV